MSKPAEQLYMKLATERLELVLLEQQELEMLIYDLPALEQKLGIRYEASPVVGHYMDALVQQLKLLKSGGECLWYSFWLIIRCKDRVVVGSADFKAPPDMHGETEIGYGLGDTHNGQGYMTEAVRALLSYAFERSEVVAVTAETETDNLASRRVLERCGFTLTHSADTELWRLTRKEPSAL